MKFRIQSEPGFANNPKFGFGASHIKDGDAVLDIGCGDSGFGWQLAQTKRICYIGLDRDRDRIAESIAKASQIQLNGAELNYVHVGEQNPHYEDGQFDVVTLFDVIEHVHDQRQLLAFAHRVLRQEGGRLIITCPKKHAFSFFDLGNFKFRFPMLNKFITIAVKGRAYYNKRFVECADGMIGDVEAEKAWHEHFSNEDMHRLLKSCGFEIVEADGMGLFGNLITIMQVITRVNFKTLRKWDEQSFDQFQLLIYARKTVAATQSTEGMSPANSSSRVA